MLVKWFLWVDLNSVITFSSDTTFLGAYTAVVFHRCPERGGAFHYKFMRECALQ